MNSSIRFGHYPTIEEFIATFPMRIPSLLLSENDPQMIDIDWWVDLYRRTHIDGLLLSAGGYVAYYPTQIPYHYKSKFLAQGEDLFGKLVERFKGLGVKYIFARTDPHAVHQDACAAHPEWIAEDIHGNKRPHWATRGAWVTCPMGSYNFDFMTAVHKEIIATYDVEFIFSNRWAGQGSGICYCEHCRKTFFDAAHLTLPAREDLDDPLYQTYLDWREERLFVLIRHWNEQLQSVKPGAWFLPNSGGGAASGLDMVRLGNQVVCMNVDRQARPTHGAPWSNGKNAKEYRATMGPKPAFAGVNVGLCGEHRWMDSTKSTPELILWLAEAVANGMVPQFTKHSSVVYNARWVKPVEIFFDWLYQHEKYFRNIRPVPEIALVYSQQTARYYGRNKFTEKVEDPIQGWYQALVETRLPFEMVHDRLLDENHLAHFKTLILPNIAALSDEQCDQLRAFVARGGNLVATFETSLYDEKGVRRADFGLVDLLGVSSCGAVESPLKNAYLNIEPGQNGAWHPLAQGLEDAGRIIYGTARVPVKENVNFPDKPLTFVPPYPNLPMEELYPRQTRTEIAEVYLREIGASRIVYFPWDIDRTFWEVLNEDHLALLGNAVKWANQGVGTVEVTGEGVLDIAVWQQQSSLTVNLVNLTNPMLMRGSFREWLQVGQQIVRISLPHGKTPQKVRLLWSGGEPEARYDPSGRLEVVVPSIEAIEVIALDF